MEIYGGGGGMGEDKEKHMKIVKGGGFKKKGWDIRKMEGRDEGRGGYK